MKSDYFKKIIPLLIVTILVFSPIKVSAADSDGDGLEDDDETNIHLTDPNDSDSDDDFLPDGDEVNTYLTSPIDADSDDDGLTDGGEVLTYLTDPLTNADLDGDGLTDAEEILTHSTNHNDTDTDDDGLDDYDEVTSGTGSAYVTNPNDSDSDDDGLSDAYEVNSSSTDPTNADSDADNLSDSYEVNTSGTNPNDSDSDDDGLNDGDEVNGTSPGGYDSSPNDNDSDDDGLTDYDEVTTGTGSSYISDPNDSDTDDDTLDDYDEVTTGTGSSYISDPNDSDSDNDSLTDDHEVNTSGTDPNDSDTDDDGIDDGDELNNAVGSSHVTDPVDSDSDDDNLNDGYEISTSLTDPNDSDSDDDGLTDGEEVNTHSTNPNDSDTDNDNLTDYDEVNSGTGSTHVTSPIDADSDDDGLNDDVEVNTHSTDPNDSDTDNDSLSDGDEVNAHSTDPLDTDTDDDGLSDGDEVNTHFTDPTDTDSDNDGRDDYVELNTAPTTNPNDSDSDDDGLSDGDELDAGIGSAYVTNPNSNDTDGDSLTDNDEIDAGIGSAYLTDPTDTDTDDDGLNDHNELNGIGTDPSDSDTDSDGLNDYDEVLTYNTDPLSDADLDSDGLTDAEEILTHLTNHNDSDSDDGGRTDGEEVNTDTTDPLDGGDDIGVADVTNPSVSTFSPADNATGVATNANLVITFDENVDAETGNILIKRTVGDTTFATIDVTGGLVSGSGGTTITINPASNFAESTGYYVQIASTAFDDTAGNSYAGINDTTTWSFTTADETAPTVTNVTSDKTNGAYTVGEVIDIDVTFSEAVTSTGNVTVTLETGATDRTCTFTVSNGTTGTCNYTVQSGDISSDLTVSSISGTIADQSANAMSNFAPATNLAANKALVIDTTSPTVSMTAPTDGATVSGSSVSLTANASDTNLVGVQFKIITNINIGTEDTTSAYGVTWDTTSLPNGPQSLVAVARDTAGNYATSTSVNVTISNDTTDPEFVSGYVDESTLVLIYDESLDGSSIPTGSDFEVLADAIEISVSSVNISDTNIVLSLASAVTEGQVVTISYTVGASPIQDEAGNEAAALVTESITNNTSDSSAGASGGGGRASSISSSCKPSDRTISVGDKVSFDIDINTTEDSYTFKWTKVLSGNDEDGTHKFTEVGKYYPRAEAKDTDGNITVVNCGTITVSEDDNEEVDIVEEDNEENISFSNSFSTDLQIGDTSEDVKKLQILLNSIKFTIATEGPGSPGNETNFFGLLTQQTLIKLQTIFGITPANGRFGPKTREFVNFLQILKDLDII